MRILINEPQSSDGRDHHLAKKTKNTTSRHRTRVTLRLTRDEVDDLVGLAHYYEKTMGLSRFFVRLASGPEMKARFRFVQQESDVLEQFASAIVAAMRASDQAEIDAEITVRALIAFWGRALSSLNSSRSRRRLSSEKVRIRTALEAHLYEKIAGLRRVSPDLLLSEIATRRSSEAQWMHERLEQAG